MTSSGESVGASGTGGPDGHGGAGGGSQQGPIYDRAMRQIAEDDPAGFCTWLGVPTQGPVELRSGSFAASTLHTDLLAQVEPARLLHVEYQRHVEADLAVRMLGYRAQIMRRHPDQNVTQIVIVLGDGSVRSCDDPEGEFRLGLRTAYLRDHPPGPLLAVPGLAPLAVLAAGDQQSRGAALLEAFDVIRTRTAPGPHQDHLLEAAAVLATIRLDRLTIDRIREESGMTVQTVADFYSETDIGRELRSRGREEGREEGREQGLEQGVVRTLARVLRRRFGNDAGIQAAAERLALWDDQDAALDAIETATSLNEIPLHEDTATA